MNPFKTILSAKINTANSQCESLAINQIKAYKEKVQINLHTVSLPNLRDVGKVWTELLFQKKKAFLLETESVMNSILYIEDHDIEYAQKIINDIFSENLYENRLVKFHEEMMRKLASHGRADIKTRLDLHDSLYKVSIINNTRFIKNQTPTEFKTIASIRDITIEIS